MSTKWEVCPTCDGEGKSSAYLGTFTADDIAEHDPEFMEDYFAGHFDRKCTECNGLRVVPEPTCEPNTPDTCDDCAAIYDKRESDAERRAEERMLYGSSY